MLLPGERLFNRDTVRLLLAPALVFIVACLDRGYQTELWQHLARGRLVWEEGAVVSVDRFTFTVPGQPLRDNNWLSQLAYFGLHSLGGLELVQAVNAAALAAAVGALVALCRRASASTGVAGAVGAVAFLGLWQTLLIRPQSFSMLLFVALYALLLEAKGRPRLLVLAPAVMALWANVHGGFAVGLALLLAFTASAAWQRVREGPSAGPFRPWAACLLAGIGATLLNPYGPGVYGYAGSLSALGVARGIEEWLPPSVGTLVGGVFFASIVVVGLVAVRCRRQVTALDLCLLGGFVVPACLSVRMTVWWFLAAAPVAARLAGSMLAERAAALPNTSEAAAGRRFSAPAAVAVVPLLTICVSSMPWLERWNPVFGAARSPRRVETDVETMAAALPATAPDDARVFARMEWANYLAWRSAGRTPVFVEGHVELYPDDTWSEYVTVNDARPGWQAVLDRRGVRFLLLDQTYHAALLSEVRESAQWSARGGAGPALLFERRAPLPVAPAEPSGIAGTDPGAGAIGEQSAGAGTDF